MQVKKETLSSSRPMLARWRAAFAHEPPGRSETPWHSASSPQLGSAATPATCTSTKASPRQATRCRPMPSERHTLLHEALQVPDQAWMACRGLWFSFACRAACWPKSGGASSGRRGLTTPSLAQRKVGGGRSGAGKGLSRGSTAACRGVRGATLQDRGQVTGTQGLHKDPALAS